jgi:hypothetical protein
MIIRKKLFAGAMMLIAAGCAGGGSSLLTDGLPSHVTSFSPKTGATCPISIDVFGDHLRGSTGGDPLVTLTMGATVIHMKFQGGDDASTSFSGPCPVPAGAYTVNYNGNNVGTYTQS